MALPPGIQAKTVTLGIASFADGSLAQGRATISMPVNVIHTTSNRPIFSSDITAPFVDGAVSFNLLPTDAPGLNRVDWSYKLKVEIQGATTQPDPIYFLLPTAGPDTVDLDGLVTVPSSAGVPISVDVLTTEDLPAAIAEEIADSTSASAAALRAASVAAVQASGAFASVAVDPLATDSTRLGRWRYGLASRQPRVLVLNDSWGDGNGATDWQHAWVRRFAARLRGAYFPGATSGSTYVSAGASLHAATAPVTFTFNGGADVNYMGLQRRMRDLGTTGTATFTFTGTGADIHYGSSGSATSFSYTVDGGTATTVSVAARGDNIEHPDYRQQIRGLVAGVHTVVVTAIGQTLLLGVFAYNGDETNGVRVYEGGRGGTGTQYWVTESRRWLPAVGLVDPHLVVLALGINDFQESANKVTSAQFKANLVSLVAQLRAAVGNDPSFVLAIPPQPSGTGLSPWSEFPAAIRAVAAEDGQIAVFDSTAVLGPSIADDNLWGYRADGFHVNDAGHQAYADSLFQLVTRFP